MKTLITLALVLCCTQIHAGHNQCSTDNWRDDIHRQSDCAAKAARDLDRIAVRHLGHQQNDIRELRALFAIRSLATQATDLRAQLHYPSLSPDCLQLITSDVSEASDRAHQKVHALSHCQRHLRRDLENALSHLDQALRDIKTTLHRATIPNRHHDTRHDNRRTPSYGHDRSHTSHPVVRIREPFAFWRGFSRHH
jgi:hypothetical protein